MRSLTSIPRLLPALALAAFTAVATACEKQATPPNADPTEGELTVDASDQTSFVYVTFADGGSEVAVTDPFTSTDWDIAFRRFSVKLNGGVAGPGSVSGVNLMNNASADSATVVGFTSADADMAWEAVTIDDTVGVTFVEDDIVPDDSGPWFTYSPIAMTLVADPGAAWKLDEGGTGFAVFRVVDMNLKMDFSLQDVTLEFRHQPSGGVLGALDSVFVDLSAGTPASIDLATGAVVAPSGCNWDFSIDPAFASDYAFTFNSACGAGTFPLDASENFATITAAGGAPEYGAFLSVLSGAFPVTIDDASGVFWYNLQGTNRLWPTYNVFLVRVGTDVYKVQITDYYSATAAPAHPTFRFELLE